MVTAQIFVTRFFQLITDRRFAEAERVLDRLRERMPKTEWTQGYIQALKGMLLTQKSDNDIYAFISTLNFNDKKELSKYRREFLQHTRNKLHADYDRGFFSAWAEYMRVLYKMVSVEQTVTSKNK